MDEATLVRREFNVLVPLIATAIATHVPSYNRGLEASGHPLRRRRQKVLRLCLMQFGEQLEPGPAARADIDLGPQRELGRLEYRHGRPLSDLVQAPWAASLAIWRHVVDVAPAAGLEPPALYRLAETVMDWSDRISLAFSEGYNDEQAAVAGEREGRRQQLVELLLRERPAPPAAVDAAAAEAGWIVPPRLSVLVAGGSGRARMRRGLPPGALAAELGDRLWVVLPDAGGAAPLHDRAPAADHDVIAALGPAVPPAETATSAARARAALELAEGGLLDASGLIDCEHHTTTLLLLADRRLAAEHSRRRLAALDRLRSAKRSELGDTLLAWLRHRGHLQAAAHELGVHPHTVAYRVNRLREVFGATIDDPDDRFELELALRLRRLLAPRPTTPRTTPPTTTDAGPTADGARRA